MNRLIVPSRQSLPLICYFVVACAVALGYHLLTGHIWEDYFITYRHSENLVNGQGLLFNPGERVHGFTSPLGVLLPALCAWICGTESYVPAFNLFLGICVLFFAAGGTLLVGLMRAETDTDKWAPWIFGAFYLLDIKAVAYATNGMETGLVLFFLALAFSAAYHGLATHWQRAGIAWAGMMWARPDGCVAIALLGMLGWCFARPSRRAEFLGMLRAALICTVLYLPWLLWAWWYYGNPVPHTIIAKSKTPLLELIFPDPTATFALFWNASLDVAMRIYQPINSHFGGWHPATRILALALVLGSVIPLFRGRQSDRMSRMAAWTFAGLVLYLTYVRVAAVTIFCWYLPPAGLMGAIVLARLAPSVLNPEPWVQWRTTLLRGAQAVALVGLAIVWLCTTHEMRVQEQLVEMGNRVEVGRWLKQHVRSQEVIYLECLGYIGYFSGGKVYDYPGLVAPPVVKLRREKQLDMYQIIPELKPEWLVLRPHEAQLARHVPGLAKQYAMVKVFNVKPFLDQISFLPGRPYVEFDATFYVFRRMDPPP